MLLHGLLHVCLCVHTCTVAHARQHTPHYSNLPSTPISIVFHAHNYSLINTLARTEPNSLFGCVCVPSCYICFAFLVGGFGALNVQHNASEYVGRIMRSMGG